MNDDGLTDDAGEGYFASISDLMVGVLFVFLLMMTVFALNFHDDKTRLDATIAEKSAAERAAKQEAAKAAELQDSALQLRNSAAGLQAQNQRLQSQLQQHRDDLHRVATLLEQETAARERARRELLQRLGIALGRQDVHCEIDDSSGVLHLSDAIPFATGDARLANPVAQQTVAILGRVLADVLPCYAVGDPAGCAGGAAAVLETVLIEGHTDDQPWTGKNEDQSQAANDELSAKRALTVFTTLRQQQPTLDGLRNVPGQKLLGISGYGQRRPLPPSAAIADEQARNRRIDLRFVLAAPTSDALERLVHEIDPAAGPAAP